MERKNIIFIGIAFIVILVIVLLIARNKNVKNNAESAKTEVNSSVIKYDEETELYYVRHEETRRNYGSK